MAPQRRYAALLLLVELLQRLQRRALLAEAHVLVFYDDQLRTVVLLAYSAALVVHPEGRQVGMAPGHLADGAQRPQARLREPTTIYCNHVGCAGPRDRGADFDTWPADQFTNTVGPLVQLRESTNSLWLAA